MTRPRGRTHLRAHRVTVLIVAVIVLAATALTAALLHWIWSPVTQTPDNADAIVVLAYGNDRLRKGRDLAQAGVSDQLVISLSTRMKQRIADGEIPVLSPAEIGEDGPPSSAWVEQCDADYGDYTTTCIYPEPNTTEGEAIATSALARTRGWDSLVVVTEPSHVNRARRIFAECVPAQNYGVASDRVGPWYRDIWRSAYEVGALGKLVVNGACPVE